MTKLDGNGTEKSRIGGLERGKRRDGNWIGE